LIKPTFRRKYITRSLRFTVLADFSLYPLRSTSIRSFRASLFITKFIGLAATESRRCRCIVSRRCRNWVDYRWSPLLWKRIIHWRWSRPRLTYRIQNSLLWLLRLFLVFVYGKECRIAFNCCIRNCHGLSKPLAVQIAEGKFEMFSKNRPGF
jgi:hypothetical protein